MSIKNSHRAFQWQLSGDAENGSTFLVHGWDEKPEGPEGRGYRWSVTPNPQILVPAPPLGRVTVTLRIEVMPFIAEPTVPDQGVWVFANGLFVLFDRIRSTRVLSGPLPAPALLGSTIPITLVLPTAKAPSEVGTSTDRRMLGVALLRLELLS